MTNKFCFEIPIFAFLTSGWFVAAYFAMMPGFQKMMGELPPGAAVNVVTPTMYLLLAAITNSLAWLIATMYYFKGDEE